MLGVMASEMPSLAPEILWEHGSVRITATMVSALVTTLIVILFALAVRIFCIPRWRKTFDKKSGLRILLESMVGMFDGNAGETVPTHSGFVGAWYFAAAAFICIGTLVEMTGLRPPTSDFNLTLSMGITTFIFIQFFGFRDRKLKRLTHFVNPLNWITDIAVPLSMSLRILGSVFSGYLIMHLIYSLPWGALIGLPAVASVIFTIFHALIQSYIYMFLSMSFIAEATE